MSPAVVEFAKSIALSSGSGLGSPQKMLPFQDFYKMFQEFSEAQAQQEQQVLEEARASTVDSTKAQTPAEDSKRKSGGTILLPDKKNLTVLVKEKQLDPVAAVTPMESINIVKQLTDIDPNFEAYLKVAGRDETQLLKTKANSSSLVKPRRIRKVAPLGKTMSWLFVVYCVTFDSWFFSDREGGAASEGLEGPRVQRLSQGIQQPLQGTRKPAVSRHDCSAATRRRRGGQTLASRRSHRQTTHLEHYW
jgi:hypothetical protein